jgi:hypothetical protein
MAGGWLEPVRGLIQVWIGGTGRPALSRVARTNHPQITNVDKQITQYIATAVDDIAPCRTPTSDVIAVSVILKMLNMAM